MIAQSVGQAGAVSVFGTLCILYAVATIYGMIRRPSLGMLLALGGYIITLYTGWLIRGWPGVSKDGGMILTMIRVWWDAVTSLLGGFLDGVGLDSAWQRVQDFFRELGSHFGPVN